MFTLILMRLPPLTHSFESELFEYMEANHNDLFETIRTTKDLPDEDELKKAIGEF